MPREPLSSAARDTKGKHAVPVLLDHSWGHDATSSGSPSLNLQRVSRDRGGHGRQLLP